LLPALATPTGLGSQSRSLPQSSDALARESVWTHPETYPLERQPRNDLYRPSAEWIGRLILPSVAELSDRQAPSGDWVWIELEQAPADHRGLIGSRLRLRWAERPGLKRLVAAVTTDIHLDDNASRAAAEANVVPTRLDGRRRVGPLQSLAGARPVDDVTVLLEEVDSAGADLRIGRPPVQITGRWQGLVTLLGADTQAAPEAAASEPADLLRVRHLNPASGSFDGAEETIRIPALPPDRFGRRLIDPFGLVRSPLNAEGWLIQGAPATDGVFTVQAIQPRALLAITAQEEIRDTAAGLDFIRSGNWSTPLSRRGSLHSRALLPDGEAPLRWRVGERALLMHLFGGIGGDDGEPTPAWTTTGHFSFGEAEVVRDAISGEPRFAIRYHQIYANNPNGIVAGAQDWSAYAGSLQRGWVGTRPFSDLLVPMGDGALDAVALQAELIAARYRSGDGTGVALVTPATSCVQDSAQALWIAIRQLRQEASRTGGTNGDRLHLRQLGDALERLLTPFGRVRGDWSENAARISAVGAGGFQTSQRTLDVLLSWRSLLPRRAHDSFAAAFLRAGLPLHVLRTNQIPGADPALEPVAPTSLMGQLPVVGTLLMRLGDSLFPPLQPAAQGTTLGILVLYGWVSLVEGFRSGFLQRVWCWPPLGPVLLRAAGYLLMPALLEELLFRALLLPHPLEGVPPGSMLAWMALSVGLFVLYHPVAARLWYLRARTLFDDPRFLLQCALLGLACSLAYGLTGSLWCAVLIHWLAVVVWLEPLQGRFALGATR
jgi:predicted Abi (CAAX) family protease